MEIPKPFYIDDNYVEVGNILGVVTSLDVVESRFTGEEVGHHSDYWQENKHYKKWRWNNSEGLHWFLTEHKPNIEQIQFVRDHLSKRYGLKWFENGYHDWEDLRDCKEAFQKQIQEGK